MLLRRGCYGSRGQKGARETNGGEAHEQDERDSPALDVCRLPLPSIRYDVARTSFVIALQRSWDHMSQFRLYGPLSVLHRLFLMPCLASLSNASGRGQARLDKGNSDSITLLRISHDRTRPEK